jgi:hypothetical protein
MPLIHSKSRKAFQHNIRAEMAAGRPQKQAVAIAYNVAGKQKRKGEKISATMRRERTPVTHSSHTDEMASAYEKSVAHTKQDFHPAVVASKMKLKGN